MRTIELVMFRRRILQIYHWHLQARDCPTTKIKHKALSKYSTFMLQMMRFSTITIDCCSTKIKQWMEMIAPIMPQSRQVLPVRQWRLQPRPYPFTKMKHEVHCKSHQFVMQVLLSTIIDDYHNIRIKHWVKAITSTILQRQIRIQ